MHGGQVKQRWGTNDGTPPLSRLWLFLAFYGRAHREGHGVKLHSQRGTFTLLCGVITIEYVVLFYESLKTSRG